MLRQTDIELSCKRKSFFFFTTQLIFSPEFFNTYQARNRLKILCLHFLMRIYNYTEVNFDIVIL